MAGKHQSARGSRKFLGLYIAFIALPVILFMYLSFTSIRRQWNSLTTQKVTDLQSGAQKIASSIEEKTFVLAESLLDEVPAKQLQALAASAKTPEQARQIRVLLQDSKKKHPIAKSMFLVREGMVQYPLVRPLPLTSLNAFVKTPNESEPAAKKFATLLMQAEAIEGQRPEQALKIYRECCALPVRDPLKALGKFRIARTLQKMKLGGEAEQVYQELERQYADQYDLANMPYALVAAFAARNDREEGREQLLKLEADLSNGRWELDSEQAERWKKKLLDRLGKPNPDAKRGGYLDELGMALELQSALASSREKGFLTRMTESGPENRPPRRGDIYAYAFNGQEKSYQTFYMLLDTSPGKPSFVGFVADMDWLQKEVLPELGAGTAFAVGFKGDKNRTRADFKRAFPFWEVIVTPPAVRSSVAQMDTFILVGSIVLTCLIALGFLLLSRIQAHEREVSKMRVDFVNGVSHEIKTPITLVRLYSETLLEDPELKPESREYCEIISREAERLTHLVEHVLDFTRVDRGLRQYNLTVGNMAPVVQRTVRTCSDYLAIRGFTVSGYISPNVPAVRFDPEAIPSVVLNLVDNAVKYSGTSTMVRVDLTAERGNVVLQVEDFGIGIAPQEREKIFEPYYRVKSDVSRGGCGLGLFLIQEIMKAHGGKIDVYSVVGTGTRFRLSFPVVGDGASSEVEDSVQESAVTNV